MDIAIMIEGQDDLNWERWQRLARAVEELGFYGLYRSDHFTNHTPPHKDALELWISLTWLASHTSRIRFGPIVSPVSFRHPALTAWMAAQVAILSNGRLTVGLGAGWQEREHHMFGLPLLDVKERFHRFEEALEVVARLLRAPHPVNFEGRFYQLRDAEIKPRPPMSELPMLIGGNGEKKTLRLAARYADEWNGVYVTPQRFAELNALLDRHLDEVGRPRGAVVRSLMHGVVWGDQRTHRGASHDELRARGVIIGRTADEVRPQLEAYRNAGVERIMLQWLELDDLAGLESFARAVLGPSASC